MDQGRLAEDPWMIASRPANNNKYLGCHKVRRSRKYTQRGFIQPQPMGENRLPDAVSKLAAWLIWRKDIQEEKHTFLSKTSQLHIRGRL